MSMSIGTYEETQKIRMTLESLQNLYERDCENRFIYHRELLKVLEDIAESLHDLKPTK